MKEEHYFWLNDGRALRDMQELLAAMQTMNEETFSHHVTSEKNDFHNWIKDVFGDTKLAYQLIGAKNATEMAQIIEKRMKSLHRVNKQKTKRARVSEITEAFKDE